jgi:hypothetical protein
VRGGAMEASVRVSCVFALGAAVGLVAACGRRGEIRYHHSLDPIPAAETANRRVRARRVSGANLPGARDQAAPKLWIELELENLGHDVWDVHTSDLRLEQAEVVTLDAYPNVATDAPIVRSVSVAPGESRRVWARFDHVHTQNPAAADAGIDSPASLALHVKTPDEVTLRLSDPARGTPVWAASWPYFATLAFGLGASFGEQVMEQRDGAMSFDVALSVHRRFGEADVGVVGLVRAGVDVRATHASAFSALGGGVTAGYTLQLGDRLYLRPAVDLLVTRSGHGEMATTPSWVAAELQLGIARRSLYPYRERRTSYTVAWYVRAERHLTSFSTVEEPYSTGLSIGIVLRGGS